MIKYKINHSFKPKILVPYIAITHNIDFLTNEVDVVTLSDNKEYYVLSKRIINIMSNEGLKLVQEIYKCDTFIILQKWYKFDRNMSSLDFVLIELKEK